MMVRGNPVSAKQELRGIPLPIGACEREDVRAGSRGIKLA